ncbi:hypothetical protein ACFWZT_36645 [Streptomyces alboflavus]|uniref:hypothetical protein n=1 Tax=Streptomyces alboflavus TaxID=67267 RepID=UPI00369527E2
MNSHLTKARTAAVSGIAAASLLGGTPAATAASQPASDAPQVRNWQGHLSGALTGFQSRRWQDKGYSQVWFKGCQVVTARDISTHVQLRWDRSFRPDKSWGTKKFTNCFDGRRHKSNGQWHGLAGGKHFFQIKKINGRDYGNKLSVHKVYVDTSKHD